MKPIRISISLSPANLARLDAWRKLARLPEWSKTHDFSPKRGVIILYALDKFLDQCGTPSESNYKANSNQSSVEDSGGKVDSSSNFNSA